MNKPSLVSKALERASKRQSQSPSLPSVGAASAQEAWKAIVTKNVREGSSGTTACKISYLFFVILLKPKFPCSVFRSYVIPVDILMCDPRCCRHLRSTSFTLTAKGIMSLGRLAVCKLFSTLYHGFPKRLVLSVQLLPFYRGHNCI